MASQRPGRDIPRLDYSTIVRVPRLDNESLPTKPPAHPPIDVAIDATIDPNLAESTPTIDATNTEPPSFNNSNIYDESDNDSPITSATSILPSESALQVPPRVPRLQAKSRTRSPAFDHFITTLLDDFYISRRSKKRTQDRQHKCKYCRYTVLDLRRDGTGNLIEHLKKHNVHISLSSVSVLASQQPTIDAMFRRPAGPQIPATMMSVEQAILEWIIDTLQPFVVVEHPSFQWIFKCLHHQLLLRSGDVVCNCIIGQLDDRILSLKDELELASSISLLLDA